jgi:hypothetical protein
MALMIRTKRRGLKGQEARISVDGELPLLPHCRLVLKVRITGVMPRVCQTSGQTDAMKEIAEARFRAKGVG